MVDALAGEAQPPRQRMEDLERPAVDDRSYRLYKLPNKLEVLLIHDTNADKASAALDVNVGNFSDADIPGTAHAVEHLLFMGTEKYPQENDFDKYITSYSGRSYATTSATSTIYSFDVAVSKASSTKSSPSTSQEGLSKDSGEDSPFYAALDRFSQFFVCPLFREDAINREIKAVDSEYKNKLQSDARRLFQLNKALSNPKHPRNRFSTGNWKTLHEEPITRGVQIWDELLKFHAQHYSANRMKLVVLGRESLNTLEMWVEDMFSKVPNMDLPQKRWDDVDVYTDKELLIQTFARPVSKKRSLALSFLYRDEEDLYESHPSWYLSHLIGHESTGSILALIKAKGWANGLSASGFSLCPGSGVFDIDVELTEEGLAHYQEIVKIVFQYIAMIQEFEPQQWVVDELIKMSKVDFRFKQKSPPSQTTSTLARLLQKPFNRQHILSGPAVIRKFDASQISKAMKFLRPDNFRLLVVSQDFPGGWDRKEKWYGTEYKTEKIPQKFIQELNTAFVNKNRPTQLHFPHKNEFIPDHLDVEKTEVEQPLKTPRLLTNDNAVRLWWKRDDQFWVPKANVHIHFRTLSAYDTARTASLASLYCDLVIDALAKYSYDADISGLAYKFYTVSTGYIISVQGYNDKLHVLLNKVLLQIRDLEVREDRFKIMVDQRRRRYHDCDFVEPYKQIETISQFLYTERIYTSDDLAKELEQITAQDVQQYIPLSLSECHAEVLCHGNLHPEEALKITGLLEHTIRAKPLPPAQLPVQRSLVLQEGSNFIYERSLKDPANVNHCIEYILYLGDNTNVSLRAKKLLFARLTHEPCFHQLRTVEQLGYIVFSGSVASATFAGYRILIQSERDCRYLESRIENFLTSIKKTLQDMGDAEFEKYKAAVISKRVEKLVNLDQEGERFWAHMEDGGYDFLQAEVDAHSVSLLTKADLLCFYTRLISPTSSHRAKLSVHLTADPAEHSPENTEPEYPTVAVSTAAGAQEAQPSHLPPPVLITDVHAWKKSMPYSKGVQPALNLGVYAEDLSILR